MTIYLPMNSTAITLNSSVETQLPPLLCHHRLFLPNPSNQQQEGAARARRDGEFGYLASSYVKVTHERMTLEAHHSPYLLIHDSIFQFVLNLINCLTLAQTA